MRQIILSILLAASFSHTQTSAYEGEQHEMQELTDTLALPVAPDPDSLNVIIDAGFKRLEPIFSRSCFDCHTARTNFPWYYKLPIVKGIIDGDIREARGHVDMTPGFPFGGHGDPDDNLKEIREEIAEGKMPLKSYLFMHPKAKLSQAEKDAIYRWVDESLKLLGSSPDQDEEAGHNHNEH